MGGMLLMMRVGPLIISYLHSFFIVKPQFFRFGIVLTCLGILVSVLIYLPGFIIQDRELHFEVFFWILLTLNTSWFVFSFFYFRYKKSLAVFVFSFFYGFMSMLSWYYFIESWKIKNYHDNQYVLDSFLRFSAIAYHVVILLTDLRHERYFKILSFFGFAVVLAGLIAERWHLELAMAIIYLISLFSYVLCILIFSEELKRKKSDELIDQN